MAASHGNLIDLSKTLSFFLSIFTIIDTDKLPAKLYQCYLRNFRFFKTPVRILTNLINRKLHFSETVSCIDTGFVLGLGTPRWGRCLAGSEYHYLLMKDHFNLGVPPAPVNPPPLKKRTISWLLTLSAKVISFLWVWEEHSPSCWLTCILQELGQDEDSCVHYWSEQKNICCALIADETFWKQKRLFKVNNGRLHRSLRVCQSSRYAGILHFFPPT